MINTLKTLVVIIGIVSCMTVHAIPVIIDLGTTIGQPAGLNKEYQRLVTLVNNYNTFNTTDIPVPIEHSGESVSINGGPKSVDISFDEPFYGYLMFKWGNMDQFYYVEDLTDYNFSSTILNQNSTDVYLGLSHWNNWQTHQDIHLADGGSISVIFGLGLTTMFFCGRKCRRN